MSKAKKNALIIAAFCIAAGLVISFLAVLIIDFDFGRLNNMSTEKNTYEVNDTFTSIDISAAECNIMLVPSQDNRCRVVVNERDKIAYNVYVENGTLTISRTDTRKWYERIGIFIGFNWGDLALTIYLPENEYENIKIDTASGDITVPHDFSFVEGEIYSASGEVMFSAAVSEKLTIKTVSGELFVNDQTVEELSVKTTSGDITLKNINVDSLGAKSTSGEIEIDTVKVSGAVGLNAVSGDITLTNADIGSSLMAKTVSGDVDLADVLISTDLIIKTTSGDIELDVVDAYNLDIHSVSGYVEGSLLSPKEFITNTTSGDVHVPYSISDTGRCEVSTTSGDIEFEIISDSNVRNR